MDIKRIEVKNYKCFKDISVSDFKPINIVIGKNNIGKSSLLDVIEFLYGLRNLGENSSVLITKTMSESIIQSVFSKDTYGGSINGNHYEFGKKYIDKDITFIKRNDGRQVLPEDFELLNKELPIGQVEYWARVASSMKIDIKITKRIFAERNIFPEENNNNMLVDSNGNGITTIISNYLNKSFLNEDLVKNNLLSKLNEIMGEDAHFTEIVAQDVGKNSETKWEIFLREEGKGRVSLSNSGSGLKTILMVLVYTILIPSSEKKQLSDYIFLFEELENNLHPSLQRRLLKYIEELTEKGSIFFLTTHSNVTLDAFQNSEKVNLLHIQKENDIKIQNITNRIQKNTVLDDLGIKASDLLQSNGIVWVEGPSDRVYVNNWIKMSGGNEYREGKDYQCVFYGGRLLSNTSLDEDKEQEFVNLLSVNRNAILIMDSDKKSHNSAINDTKKRIKEEAEKNGIMVWITKGREIENYISTQLLKKYYGINKRRIDFKQFENIEDFIDKLKKNEGKKFLRNKNEFAKKITEIAVWDEFKNVLDLDKRIKEVKKRILSWNKY